MPPTLSEPFTRQIWMETMLGFTKVMLISMRKLFPRWMHQQVWFYLDKILCFLPQKFHNQFLNWRCLCRPDILCTSCHSSARQLHRHASETKGLSKTIQAEWITAQNASWVWKWWLTQLNALRNREWRNRGGKQDKILACHYKCNGSSTWLVMYKCQWHQEVHRCCSQDHASN